jgi:hypothetical protein
LIQIFISREKAQKKLDADFADYAEKYSYGYHLWCKLLPKAQGHKFTQKNIATKRYKKEFATEGTEIVLNFEFLVLSCGVCRWRMADFIIVFMAHNTLSKGELRL